MMMMIRMMIMRMMMKMVRLTMMLTMARMMVMKMMMKMVRLTFMSLPLAIMPKTLVFTAFLLFVQHTVQECGARHDKHPCTTYCARMWSRTSCHKHLCFWRASPKQRFRFFAQHTVHVVLCFCVKRPQQKKHTKPSKATS